jgi:hypothetical protein
MAPVAVRFRAMRALFALPLLLASGLIEAAQWELVREPVPDREDAEVAVALVENEAGHSLRVYLDGQGVVRGLFTLRSGLLELVPPCPTLRIDDRQPRVVALLEQPCGIEADHVNFALGRREGDRVRSDAVLRLMNGNNVFLSYRLDALGYQETSFTLRRSKQALEGAVARESTILEE